VFVISLANKRTQGEVVQPCRFDSFEVDINTSINGNKYEDMAGPSYVQHNEDKNVVKTHIKCRSLLHFYLGHVF